MNLCIRIRHFSYNMNLAAPVTHGFNSSFVPLQSHLSDLPASLASDVFPYNLSQSIGGFINCRPMQQTASEFCSILFICYNHMGGWCAHFDQLCEMLREARRADPLRNGPRSTCVTSTSAPHPPRLFEASLISAFRIKLMKKEDEK